MGSGIPYAIILQDRRPGLEVKIEIIKLVGCDANCFTHFGHRVAG